MRVKCIENKSGNANFTLNKIYEIDGNNISCDFLYLSLGDINASDEFDFAFCKFKRIISTDEAIEVLRSGLYNSETFRYEFTNSKIQEALDIAIAILKEID